MKPNELRIGNYVDIFDITQIVKEIFEDSIAIDDDRIDIDSVDPIPLTEDRLKRLGLERNKNYERLGNLYELGNMPDYQFIDSILRIYDDFYYGFMPDIKYVHQLQNLYFCLVGKELVINH